MQLSEREIEDFVYNDLTLNYGEECNARGLELDCLNYRHGAKIHWVRQLNLDPYGIADIVGYYRCEGMIHIELIELKARPIETKDFEQIMRYHKAISVFTRNTLKWSHFNINMSLIGTEYSGMYLQNMLPVDVYSCRYDIKGLDFTCCGKYPSWHIPSAKDKSFRDLLVPKIKTLQLNGKAVYGY